MIGKKKTSQPTLFIPGSMEDFIPADHILKKVDRVLDLSWLRDEVAGLYSEDSGRPGIAPESAVRLMLAGFFHGIVHDRKLMREAQVNIAIRWFAGYALDEALPDHSSLTRIRQRWGAELFEKIFKRTVEACAAAGLVSGETVHIDATLIRADVSWESMTREWAGATLRENSGGENVAPRKPASGKQPKKHSTTDPDATLTTSSREFRMEPSFKQHTAVDDKAGVIVDIQVTTGEDSEGTRLPATIDRVQEATGRAPARVTADAAYAHGKNYAECEARGIDAVIPPQKTNNTSSAMPSSMFKFDAKHQRVRCPAGQYMTTTSRTERGNIFRMSARVCAKCEYKTSCVPASAKNRTILIVDGYESLLRARRRRAAGWDERAADSYKRHRWRVEGAHGEAKTQHGLRRAVRRGIDNVSIQAWLTAAAMNLKRLAASMRALSRLMALHTRAFPAFSAPSNFFIARRLNSAC